MKNLYEKRIKETTPLFFRVQKYFILLRYSKHFFYFNTNFTIIYPFWLSKLHIM